MSDILISVNGQDLTITSKPKVASEGVNEDHVVFTLDAALDGYGLMAVFYKDGHEDTVYQSPLDAQNTAVVPWEVMDEAGKIWVGLCGTKDDVIYTSEVVRYKIVKGKYGGSESQPPTPGVYDQMLTIAGEMHREYASLKGSLEADLANEKAVRASGDTTLTSAIAAERARIDAIVADGGATEVEAVLFEGTARYTGESYTLSAPAANYDFLDLYVYSSGQNRGVYTIPTNAENNFTINLTNISDYNDQDHDDPVISASEITVRVTGSTLNVVNHAVFHYQFDNSSVLWADNLTSASNEGKKFVGGYISKIVGRKRVTNSEVIDLRTGEDGTTYASAGNAVRSQVAALKTSVTNVQNDLTYKNARMKAYVDDGDNILDSQIESVNSDLTRVDDRLSLVETDVLGYIDGAFVEDGVAYFTHNGEVMFEVSGIGGGGGGGGDVAARLTVTNTSGWISKTISEEADTCPIVITWSSIEDDMPTGAGSLAVSVNKIKKTVRSIEQGVVNLDLRPYLSAGSTVVEVTVTDVYGQHRTIRFTVNMVSLKLESSFDSSVVYTGETRFAYTPTGSVTKTVHFIVDNVERGTVETTASGRQLTYMIPELAAGVHAFECYFTAEVNGESVESNHLRYDLMIGGGTQPMIASDFRQTTVDQYETLSIPYTVYNPDALTADITITANGTQIAALTVDRTVQTLTYRCDRAGNLAIVIRCGTASKTISMVVNESEIDVEAETENLALYLTSAGRSNSEEHPGVWESGDISASMTGFDFVSNGWINDSDGITALRVSGGARVTIPYKIFAEDFRGTGKTIEVEFATRNVLNYEAVIMNCMSGDRGLSITPQKAILKSEQSSIGAQYKEDEHIRITFVTEKRSENRLLMVYINGIASGVVQYPTNDDFSQLNPVNITIGSDDCAMDIYCIRVYDNDLTRYQVLNNWIADTQIGSLMKERYDRNNVYDEYGNVVISKLPPDLPYMIVECPETPQYKGDKKIVSGQYVDPVTPAKSFTFEGCQMNVQGTSSAPYARKNYDMQFKQGFDMSGGTHEDNYALAPTVVPFNRFVLKADVASSEGANNVELVMLYCDATPFKRREQIENPKVRQGIYGKPIVLFWHNTNDDTTTLLGKYNFNLPKRAPEPYGYSGDMESWEFQNNTSDLMLFKTDYFDETMYTDPSTGETKEKWRFDYEARFPSDEWTDYSKLQELQSFVVSTWREQATGNNLPSAVTYGGTTYAQDTADYRLAKFKAEFGNYAEVNSFIFYYIFTELFLMVDSRAKNLFIGFSGSDAELDSIDRKAVAEPYDMDTAIGTNNEGALVFGYSYEDIDHLEGGANVFNGQDSVLWCNIRDAFPAEIVSMYQTLRTQGVLSFESVERRFEEHQSKWPEAIFDEDAWYKYIDPLVSPDRGKEPTASYLPMMQGSKAEQRKWWLYNRFKYMDSKWNAGDALAEWIQVRGYAKANITVTPYADIYPTVKYGSYLVSERGEMNQPTTLVCPIDTLNDTEIYVYSASQVKSVGDLSGLKVGFADFSKATKLQDIKLGDASASYDNSNLRELHLGSNTMLKTIDVRNCSALGTGDMKSVDISGCTNIEEVYFEGTKIQGVNLPNGGVLKKLHLPNTVTNLTIMNQKSLTDLTVAGYTNISTLRLEGLNLDTKDILGRIPAGARVRIIGFHWEMSNYAAISALYDTLDTMRGLDEYGSNVDKAQMSGVIHTAELTGAQIVELQSRYPFITLTADTVTSYLYYYNWDGSSLVNTETILNGGDGTYTGRPTRTSTAQYDYTFLGWSRFTDSDVADANATKAVLGDRNVYAAYSHTVRKYTVKFYNSTTLLQTVENVPYGGSATYTGTTPTPPTGQSFTGWAPTPTNIQGNTNCYAQFSLPEPEHTITDTWAQIFEHIETGDYATRYSIGDTMSLNLGSEGYINMQIVAFDTDDRADGNGKAPITWISEHALKTSKRMNPSLVTNYKPVSGESFKRGTTSTTYTDYNRWVAQNPYYANNTAKITITATAVTDGTLRLQYKTGAASGNNASLKINGTEVAISYSEGDQNYDLTIVNGTTYVIEFTHTKLDTANATQGYIKLANTSGSGTKTNVEALVTQSNPVIEECLVREADSYESGTGAIGGYAASEMRTYIQSTIKPLIPAEIRNKIKTVTKYTMIYNTTGAVENNVTSSEDVWIPSYREVTRSGETLGPYYTAVFPSAASRAKRRAGQTSTVDWWLRSASSKQYFQHVISSGADNGSYAYYTHGVVIGFCT